MYGEIMKDTDRVWCVCAYGKLKDDPHRFYNYNFNVIAKTIEEAIGKVNLRLSEGKIVSVSHKGAIDIG